MFSEAIVTDIVAPLVTTWLSPKLESFTQKLGTKKHVVEHTLESKFTEYLSRTYEKNSYMNTIIFRNVPQKIEDLYIPLTLRTKEEISDIIMDDDISEFFRSFDKVLITDSAGMGKSTLLKWIFRKGVEFNIGIPIFIELRKLSKNNTVIDELFKELNSINEEYDKEFILELIHKGDFIFYFDGYDEIPLDSRNEVTEDLQNFISKASSNKFILSSRPNTAIVSFRDFYEFNIKPLTKSEAYKLLEIYDKNNNLSDPIIDLLESKTHGESLKEFLINPLMVSLLYKGYEYKQTISYKKSIFYRQVFDALYENHDLTKGGAYIHQKFSELDIEEFHSILRVTAYLTIKVGKVEYEKDEIINYLTQAKELTKIDFKESLFLKDLVSSVPLFYEEGNYFRWKHKSLQEYFAALYICTDTKGKQELVLTNMYNSENFKDYLNILDLCYDVDYKNFEKSILYFFSEEIHSHFKSFEPFVTEIPEYDIKKRMNYTFGKQYYFIPVKNKILVSSDLVENQDLFLEEFDKECNKAENYIKENYKKVINGYENIAASIDSESKFILLVYEKNNNSILKLLASKSFKFISYSTPEQKANQDFTKLNDFLGQIENEGAFLSLDKFSVLNRKENYILVNDFIEIGNYGEPQIDFEGVSEFYQKLVREKLKVESQSLYDF